MKQETPIREPSQKLKDNFNQIKILYQNYLKIKKDFQKISNILENKKDEFNKLVQESYKDQIPLNRKLIFDYSEKDQISLEISIRDKTGMELLP